MGVELGVSLSVCLLIPFHYGDKTGMPNTSTVKSVILICRESFGQPRHRWEDDIKMHPEIAGSEIFSGFYRLRIGDYGHGVETFGPIKP